MGQESRPIPRAQGFAGDCSQAVGWRRICFQAHSVVVGRVPFLRSCWVEDLGVSLALSSEPTCSSLPHGPHQGTAPKAAAGFIRASEKDQGEWERGKDIHLLRLPRRIPQAGGSPSRSVLSRSSGCWKAKTTVPAGRFPSEGREQSVPCLSPSFWGVRATLAFLISMHRRCLCLHLGVLPVFVSVFMFPTSIRTRLRWDDSPAS